jgi:deoxyribonuclease-4
MTAPGKEMLIGPHVSVAGGLANAFPNGERSGATCVQIFTRNQRAWRAKPLEAIEAERFREAWKGSPIREVMSHGSYLTNLASPDPALWERSRETLRAEVERCRALDIRLLAFHPGAHMGSGIQAGCRRIAVALRDIMAEMDSNAPRLLLETTAGQGTSIGSRLVELEAILDTAAGDERIGVCVDTCHVFAAGYDIADEESWMAFWEEFGRLIGMDRLRAFHLNDSKTPLGSRKDRHQVLGGGAIGGEFFGRLARDARFLEIPMFLETPGGEAVWREEIRMLRKNREAG